MRPGSASLLPDCNHHRNFKTNKEPEATCSFAQWLQAAKAGPKPAFGSGLHYHRQRRKIRSWKKKKGTVVNKKLKKSD